MIAITSVLKVNNVYIPNHTIRYSYNISVNNALKELTKNKTSLIKTIDENHFLVKENGNITLVLTENSPWYSFMKVKWNKKQTASFNNLVNELLNSEEYSPYLYEL